MIELADVFRRFAADYLSAYGLGIGFQERIPNHFKLPASPSAGHHRVRRECISSRATW
jgi:hypothetical protein